MKQILSQRENVTIKQISSYSREMEEAGECFECLAKDVRRKFILKESGKTGSFLKELCKWACLS